MPVEQMDGCQTVTLRFALDLASVKMLLVVKITRSYE